MFPPDNYRPENEQVCILRLNVTLATTTVAQESPLPESRHSQFRQVSGHSRSHCQAPTPENEKARLWVFQAVSGHPRSCCPTTAYHNPENGYPWSFLRGLDFLSGHHHRRCPSATITMTRHHNDAKKRPGCAKTRCDDAASIQRDAANERDYQEP